MSETLRIKWTIILQTPPQPLLHCSRCNGTRSFRSSDRIRVNANGKRIDAWLIYKCTACDNTWNRPVLERRHVQSIDPSILTALRLNDPALARRLAFDAEGLKRCARQIEAFNDVVVLKQVLLQGSAPTCRLEILCAVPQPVTLRLDRLVAAELRLSRNRARNLERDGALAVFPGRLRGSVRDGMRVTVELPGHDADLIGAASSNACGC